MANDKYSSNIFMKFDNKNTLYSQISLKLQRCKNNKLTEHRWLLVIIFVGMLLHLGRYDWGTEVSQYSLRGFLCSAYFFSITIYSLFFLLRNIFQQKKYIWGLTLAFATLFSLPYRWLKLERFYYYRERSFFYEKIDFFSHWARPWAEDLLIPKPSNPIPITNWLPGAWKNLNDMPHEALFFIVLLAMGLLILVICLKVNEKHTQNRVQSRRYIYLLFGLFLIILLQSYLHLSLRSPYVYITHFGRPPEQNQLYVKFLFPDYEGAVNADVGIFRALENHFMGTSGETYTSDIRRAYPFYISSQLSYFIGMYKSFLFINILLWYISCLCAYLLGRNWWNQEVGLYMAFFVGCGPGFIMYVAQPMMYLSGFAAIVIIIYLFERLLIGTGFKNVSKPTMGNFLLFGCIVGLGSLVYDFFAWYVFFLLYGLFRRISLKGLMVSLGVGLSIYSGFLWIQTGVLHITLNTSNSGRINESIKNIFSLVVQKRIGSIYTLTLNFFGTYLNQLTHVFFVIPVILALCGIFLIRNKPQIRTLSFLLLLPSLISFAFLYYGGTKFGTYLMSSFARFNYSAYLGIYLLASGMLYEGRKCLSQKVWPWVGSMAIWIILVFVFVLSNIDAFGFLPQLYYYFYFTSGGYF